MCCFSGRVASVSDTKIFAREAAPGGAGQLLVYEMSFAAKAELAMILPLPVPPRPREDAVRFIALDGYRDFFKDLKKGFPEPVSRGAMAMSLGAQTLKIADVGDFEASFVPSQGDFDRLDDRFRLPAQVWDALPGYRDFGFAVFKLKPGRTTAHPMAFEFPRRDPSRVFFPTVHVHDGKVHAKAGFDHALYCQGFATPEWRESQGAARTFVDVARACGIVDGDAHVHQRQLRGTRANEDIYV